MTVIRAADAAGGYESLTEEQGAADEYWPLMRLKPQLWPPDGLLASQVFLVAGGDGARVGAVARLAAARRTRRPGREPAPGTWPRPPGRSPRGTGSDVRSRPAAPPVTRTV